MENNENVEVKRPLTKRTWFIVVMFFVFWPYSLWLFYKRGDKKTALALLALVIAVYIFGPAFDNDSSSQTSSAPTTVSSSSVNNQVTTSATQNVPQGNFKSGDSKGYGEGVGLERQKEEQEGLKRLKQYGIDNGWSKKRFEEVKNVLRKCNLDFGRIVLPNRRDYAMMLKSYDTEIPFLNDYCYLKFEYEGDGVGEGRLIGVYLGGKCTKLDKSWGLKDEKPICMYKDGKYFPDKFYMTDIYPTIYIKSELDKSASVAIPKDLKRRNINYSKYTIGNNYKLSKSYSINGKVRHDITVSYRYVVEKIDKDEEFSSYVIMRVDRRGRLVKEDD